jgi:hypothetical protein
MFWGLRVPEKPRADNERVPGMPVLSGGSALPKVQNTRACGCHQDDRENTGYEAN